MKAIWNGKVIAESDKTEIVENNHYFPADSIQEEYFTKSDYTTVCPWKGAASYYNLEVDGATNENAAWYYPNPKEAAQQIENHVAFWKGVEIKE
jgi:uncharacterized protein (DUF427 family)